MLIRTEISVLTGNNIYKSFGFIKIVYNQFLRKVALCYNPQIFGLIGKKKQYTHKSDDLIVFKS